MVSSIAEEPHRITVGPFDDFDSIIAANNARLQQMGYPAIDPAELALPIASAPRPTLTPVYQERMAIEAEKIEAKRVADEEARALRADQAEKVAISA